jgi:hypothetical protein
VQGETSGSDSIVSHHTMQADIAGINMRRHWLLIWTYNG